MDIGGGEPRLNASFDDGVEVFVVEHTGEIDDRACGAGDRDRPEPSPIVQCDGAVVDDDDVGLQRAWRPEVEMTPSGPAHSCPASASCANV